ncbi:hypothetical protein [Holdemania massiliensis]|nr:hypothetical protein [Holdemania massiliensis]MCH1941254.1 hypothetical protein [Holdemania massiliensis]
MNDVKELQLRIDLLEKENQYLKDLLNKAGISFNKPSKLEVYQQNQGH